MSLYWFHHGPFRLTAVANDLIQQVGRHTQPVFLLSKFGKPKLSVYIVSVKHLKTITFVLILLLAAGLRFARLDAQSFWNDEGNSARIAERPVDKIIEGAAGDIHPPGYYLLLAGWRELVGQSEFGLRSLSVMIGVLAVAVLIQLAQRLFGPVEAAVAGVLMAAHPFQVYYAQEARMYALLTLLSLASILLTAAVLTLPVEMKAGRFKPKRVALIIGGYVLVNAAGLYTHYTFPLVIAAETLAFLIWVMSRSKKGHGIATWVGLQVLTLLLFLPWLGTAIRQVTTWPSGFGASLDITQFLVAFAYGETLLTETAQVGLVPLLMVAVVGLLAPIVEADWGGYLNFGERISLILVWCLLIPGALLLIGINNDAALKFLLPANAALLIIVGRGIVMGIELGRPGVAPSAAQGGWLLIAVLAVAALALYPQWVGLTNLYTDSTFARDDYRAIAARIEAEAGMDAAVVLNAPNQWEVFTYYYPDGPNIAPLPDQSTEQTLNRLFAEYNQIYALYWGAEQQDPDGSVRQMLEQNAFPLGSDWYGGVQLVTYVPLSQNAVGITALDDQRFGGIMQLVGYTLNEQQFSAGDALGLSLYWQTTASIDERLKVFMHLYTFDGALVAQHDSEPSNGTLPTIDWPVGETVIDNHGVLLPSDLPAGDYRLAVGVYQLDGTRLMLPSGEDVLTLQNIGVQ